MSPAGASTDAMPSGQPPRRIGQWRQRLRELGARPSHEHQVLRLWATARASDDARRRPEHFYPSALQRALPGLDAEWARLARVAEVHPAADGSQRLLVALADGRSVESVLLPRAALCISSQAGCAVGCVFCMTGRGGLERQLGSAEMVAQVALARARRAVAKVVFMGMGEPAHNLDNVLEAIDLLGTEGGIGHKQLVLSTVGDLRVFERLAAASVKPALALSLHSTFAQRRMQLLPNAAGVAPQALVELADEYARLSGYPAQIQWTLLAGINDGDDEVDGLIRLLSGKRAILNLIPYNRVDGLEFARPAPRRCEDIVARLMRHRILTKLRRSAAQDVDGACGQLRARSVARVELRRDAALGR